MSRLATVLACLSAIYEGTILTAPLSEQYGHIYSNPETAFYPIEHKVRNVVSKQVMLENGHPQSCDSDKDESRHRSMASASSTSARSLFVDSKMRLADRVQVNVNNVASLARQIQRGSRSSEILMQSSRNFALQEHGLENSEANLKKLVLITSHLEFQLDAIDRNSAKLEEVTEQVRAMQR